MGNFGCVVCHYCSQKPYVEIASDSGVDWKLQANAHNQTDYSSICSKENRCQTGNCQSHLGKSCIFHSIFGNISSSDTMSHQISFDTFICVSHGSLNEAFMTHDNVVSIDSIVSCMEQGGVLESHKQLNNIVDDQYRSSNANERSENDEFSNYGSSCPSKVYPDATYNTVKSCVSIVKNSGCTQLIKKECHSYNSFMKKFSFVDEVYHDCKIRETTAYIQEFGVLVKYQEPRLIANHRSHVQFTNLKEWVIKAHLLVKKSGLPNYMQCRLPVPSELNIFNWRRLLKNYSYSILCEYLEFGFPLNIDYNKLVFQSNTNNHNSAMNNRKAVTEYFVEETRHLAIAGPFDSQPFDNIHYSPLLVRPKPNGKHRVIVDMSWPPGKGVNACVPDDKLDCLHIKLAYPTIDNLVSQISRIGPHALLYKVDLQRAYRNLRVDPLDYPAMGLKWEDRIFVDVALAFGFKGGASFCQLCTDAVTYLMSTKNYWVMSYLDDVIGVDNPEKALGAYHSLLNLLEQLGLPVNMDKISAPVSKLICLGIEVDAKTGTLSIPQEKLDLQDPSCTETIIVYLEFLVLNGLSASSLHNHLAVLNHFFALYCWPVQALSSRAVFLFCKSVKMNSKMNLKLKGVFTIPMLTQLIQLAMQEENGPTYRAIFLFAFFTFTRLASLVPNSVRTFDRTRLPLVKDIIWAKPGGRFILKSAKNMQAADAFKILQFPKLANKNLCPVRALQSHIHTLRLQMSDPLFSHRTQQGISPITCSQVRSTLAKLVSRMGYESKDYSFHAFRRSGASFAFQHGVPIDLIKSHGHWKSDAVWRYIYQRKYF